MAKVVGVATATATRRPAARVAVTRVRRDATRVAIGAVAVRSRAAHPQAPGRFARRVARLWPWFLGAAVAGYLGLMPGMVLVSGWGVANERLVVGLAAFAFLNFALALAAVRAHDRLPAAPTTKERV